MSRMISIIKSDIKDWYYKKIKKMTIMEIKLKHLRRVGMKIGTECYFFSDKLETAEPYLITIGNHVTIAPDVSFATHDASANFYLENTSDIYGRINIGNYVFIGMGSMILPGVTIADHTIIAAGSIVTKSFQESEIVIGGNPAKKIGTIEELKKKNIDKTLMTWGMSFDEKKKYLLQNEKYFSKR